MITAKILDQALSEAIMAFYLIDEGGTLAAIDGVFDLQDVADELNKALERDKSDD